MTSHQAPQRRVTRRQKLQRTLIRSGAIDSFAQVLRKSWWVTTALLLLVGAIARFDLITNDDLGPLARGSEVAAGDTTELAALADEFDSYQSVHYAGLDIALVDYRAIPVNNSGRPIVVADLAIRNTSSVQIRVPLDRISLVSPDGEITAVDRFEYAEHSLRLVVEPGESQKALAVFKLGSALTVPVEDYDIQVGEQGRWPEHLSLDGEVSPSAYPKPLTLTDDADTPSTGETIRYEGVEMVIDYATTSLHYGAYRAPIGRHLAVIALTVTGEPTLVERAPLGIDHWVLVDDNGEQRPVRATVLSQSFTGETASLQLVFSYSTESSELRLLIGDDQQAVGIYEVQAFE